MTRRPTLESLLERFSSVVSVGPRDHLAIERLVRSRATWAPGELRAALASILARSEDQWDRIAKIYDEALRSAAVREAEHSERQQSDRVLRVALSSEGERRSSERLTDHLERRKRSIRDRFRNAPRWMWSAFVGLVVALPLAIVWFALTSVSPPPVPPTSVADVETPPLEDLSGVVLIPVEIDTDLDPTVMVEPPTLGPLILAGTALGSLVTLILGLSWLRLPSAYRKRRSTELEAQAALAEDERRELQEAKAAEGRALGVRYHVDLHLPVSRQTMLDSAESLGRIFGESPGFDLDAEATLDRTLEAAGRFTPVHEPRLLRHDVVLLIDTEEGSHPWLDTFLRLVDAWRAQGVVFRAHTFHGAPDFVVEAEARHSLRLEDLARQTEDLPLIIFSRKIDHAARQGAAEWLSELDAWPRRAWIDPDPRPRNELGRYRKRTIWELEQHRIYRFHLTDDGVVKMSRYLARGWEGPPSESREPPMARSPRPSEDNTPEGEALRLWALVAALVPDPTWDQLEAIRRHFPEIHGPLPEPRYVQRLLEWVENRTNQSPELSGGRGLAITEKQQDEWLREQLRRARDDPGAHDLLDRARELLLEQLESTRPEDPADEELWRFKRAMHEAMLEPHRAAELLGCLGESGIRHEALRWLKTELARRDDGYGKPLPRADREVLGSLVGKTGRIPLRACFDAPRKGWDLSSGFVTLGFVSAFLIMGIVFEPLRGVAAKPAHTVIVDRPTIYKVEERIHLPEMVTLPAGSFMMGDANSEWNDERPVHDVVIAEPFEISRSEVTVEQYRACWEAGECEEPDTGEACNWTLEGRDTHPINCVSWGDAKRYAEWIGARLPTEAEWEYAARSGGLDREYPWGDEPATCERAVVSERDIGTGCDGVRGTQPVCSKPAGSTQQGVCDMVGNVWEWVEDDWHDDYSGAPAAGVAWIEDPRSSIRVIRGGSWRDAPRLARVARRGRAVPSFRFGNLGFRVARSLPSTL